MKPMNIGAELAVIVGKGPMPRSEVVKKLWAYIAVTSAVFVILSQYIVEVQVTL